MNIPMSNILLLIFGSTNLNALEIYLSNSCKQNWDFLFFLPLSFENRYSLNVILLSFKMFFVLFFYQFFILKILFLFILKILFLKRIRKFILKQTIPIDLWLCSFKYIWLCRSKHIWICSFKYKELQFNLIYLVIDL